MRPKLTTKQKEERKKQKEERKRQLVEMGQQIDQAVANYGNVVGECIKRRRREQGYTQEEFSIMLGISKDSLMDYEKTGELKFPTRVFLAMCEILDCSPQYLMGIDELPHREATDIHAATGLSTEAIKVLSTMKKYNDDKHDPISPLILAFISQLITDVDFLVVERHIRAMVDVETYEEIAKKNDHKEIRNALEMRLLAELDADVNPSTDTLEILNSIQAFDESKKNRQDIVDATAFRFSHDVTKVLDSFSEKKMPIVREQIQKEREEVFHGYEAYRKRG